MRDFSLGYDLHGEHFGLGVGLCELPEMFTVREHRDDGTYVETPYVPRRTCTPLRKNGERFDPDDEDSSLDAICSECHGYLGEGQDVFFVRKAFCASCGAKVVTGHEWS